MTIKFYKGDSHETSFRFKNYDGKVDNVFFTVKDLNKNIKISKELGKGITLEDGWYHIHFEPKDTENLKCEKMIFIIKINVEGSIYTVHTDKFDLDEV